MTTINAFFRILCFACCCLAATFSAAQVNQMPNPYTTGNEYETAATTASGSTAVVVLQKPTLQVRLSSYNVATNGSVTLKGVLDLASNAKKVNVVMLTETRLALVQVTTADKQRVTIFDLNASGNFTQKGDWTGPTVKSYKPGVARLSNSAFVTGVALSTGGLRMTTFTVSSNGTITKKDDDDNGTIERVDLVRLSASRVVAGVRLANDQMKVICFDVNETTYIISRRGDYQWGGAIKQVSMAAAAANKLACFNVDMNSRLDATSFELSSSGNFIVKDQKNDIKKPGTSNYYQLKELDGQYLGSNGKFLLSAIRTSDQLSMLPFLLNSNGTLNIQSGEYSPNSPNFNLTYSAILSGGKLIASNRQMNNKYTIQCYNWTN